MATAHPIVSFRSSTSPSHLPNPSLVSQSPVEMYTRTRSPHQRVKSPTDLAECSVTTPFFSPSLSHHPTTDVSKDETAKIKREVRGGAILTTKSKSRTSVELLVTPAPLSLLLARFDGVHHLIPRAARDLLVSLQSVYSTSPPPASSQTLRHRARPSLV